MEAVENSGKPLEITPELVQSLKAKYGSHNLHLVEVVLEKSGNEDDADGEKERTAEYIVRTPTRAVMDAIGEHGIKKEVTKANKVLLSNCVLAGNMDLLESDGTVYAALLGELSKLQVRKQVRIKKL